MKLNIERLQENLKIQCHECHGLCCVALYFSKIDGFPEDKLAGNPCNHLLDNNQCHIYNSLKEMKMKGCMIYDCFGAGQIPRKPNKRAPKYIHNSISSGCMPNCLPTIFGSTTLRIKVMIR